MSTLIGESSQSLIENEEAICGYFHHFSKSSDQLRIGLEAEFFCVDSVTGQSLPFEGACGIHAVLGAFHRHFGYVPVFEQERMIALRQGETFITLEPGGQIELSSSPVSDVFTLEEHLKTFLGQAVELESEFPSIAWLAAGIHPVSRIEETASVPKRRYAIMWDYLGQRGSLSREMMRLTATNQITVDYCNETDAMEILRVVYGVTSIVSALFAHSCMSAGGPNGYLTKRLHIWNHTAPERTGLVFPLMREDTVFKDYANYVLDIPLIFLVRRHDWIAVNGKLTFRDYLREGYQGLRATWSDFELHLSSIFPEVRLKQYVEIRGADGQSPELIPALAAFWKGLLYDKISRQKAWDLVASLSDEERLRFHREVPMLGLRAQWADRPALDLASELVRLSWEGLERQQKPGVFPNECVFLQCIIKNILDPALSPAERLLAKWHNTKHQNVRELIRLLRVERVD